MQVVPTDPLTRAAGGAAIVSSIISAIGVVFLLTMFALFATPYRTQALTFGLLNDICVAIQYLLTIPIAVALHRILRPQNPTLILAATILGLASMLLVIALQLALIFQVLTFQQQGVWVSLAMIAGVGAWLLTTGLAGRSVEGLPNSVLMSAIAVPYLGYPAWAFWLGRHLLGR
jgi:hypothetical protein